MIRKKGCSKKNVKKSHIEDIIINEARKQLTNENIEIIIKEVYEFSKSENSAPHIAELKRQVKENAKAIENLLVAIERGENLDILMERLSLKRNEKNTFETALAKAQLKTAVIDEQQVRFFFRQLQNGGVDDERTRKALVAVFINKIYLYDDKIRIIFNATECPITVDVDLLNEIEALENGGVVEGGRCSYAKDTSPPARTNANTKPIFVGEVFAFVFKSPLK